MIDRQIRDQIASVIRSYVNDEVTAFQLDEALTEASSTTNDKTVHAVVHALWFHYDGYRNHKIVASKEEWDYFNRLLLLLESDGEMGTIKSWREWHPLQGVAALLFLIFVVVAVRVGFGKHLFAYALPFGPLSMFLAWIGARRRRKAVRADEIALTPFPSFSSLRAARRRVGGFTRRRYPRAIASRRIRAPIIDKLMWLPWSIAWCMFSPVALFFQMLPERKAETRITMPEPSAGAYGVPHAPTT